MKQPDPKWTCIHILDDWGDGAEFQLFQKPEDLTAYTQGESPAHVTGDVGFGEGSSWTEFGEGRTDDPYCDDNIVCEAQNIVPWKTKTAFDAWAATLTQV
jgi:hypothetical protein